MGKGRLEAFSDGVIAIIITIMVLELKVPAGTTLADIRPLIPILSIYALSFVFIGTYWNNHHHMLQTVHHVNGAVLWANLHLLFWLSLVPFGTRWMGESHFAPVTVALYGLLLLMGAIAYYILSRTLVAMEGPDSKLAVALGRDYKGKLSLAFYALGVLFSFRHPRLSVGLYVFVALLWLIPDRRIEKAVEE